MKKWYYNRFFLFSVIALLMSSISITIYANWNYLMSHIFDVLKYAFGIIGIISTLYNYYRKFHLFITRIKIVLLNNDATWNTSAVFDGEFDEEIQRKIKNKIDEFDEKSEIQVIDNHTFQVFSRGLTLYFEYSDVYNSDEDKHHGHLVMRVRDYHASYSNALDTLDAKIVPLLTMLEKEARPNESKYSFRIEFGENNPFMGLVVKHIDKASIEDFSFSYNKSVGLNKRFVRVNKKGIECTTNTLTDFQSASGNFLVLVGE